MPLLSFSRLIALWGMLAACTFSNYHPPLAQAVAPGYKVVRVLPSNPAPYSSPEIGGQQDGFWPNPSRILEAEFAGVERQAVPGPSLKPEPAVAVVSSVPEIAEAPVAVPSPEPEVVKSPEEELVEPAPAAVPQPKADNRYALAEEALGRGAYADAFSYFLSLVEDNPRDSDFFFRAGFSAFMAGANNQGESWFPQAIALLQRCLELQPQHTEGLFVLGCVYDWSEEWFAAEQAYKRAIEMDPGHRKSIQNLAALYQRQGLDFEARELLILLRRL